MVGAGTNDKTKESSGNLQYEYKRKGAAWKKLSAGL
jgi:hypothetical protein